MTNLSLVRLEPDPDRFAAWAAKRRFLPERGGDLGYAIHAAFAATLGSLAPKPFYWRQRDRNDPIALYGYTGHTPETIAEAARIPSLDPDVGDALGIGQLTARAMPMDWQAGRILAFETRVRPVVRQNRDGDRNRFREVDVAAHIASQVDGPPPEKARAYCDWVARQFAGAATVTGAEVTAMRSTVCLRRPHRDGRRSPVPIDGPDVVVTGTVHITDPAAFAGLIGRGLGRHRSFGFGMVLLAPKGAL